MLVNKWSCKLCGKKQTLLKEFGRGSGADCRRHVQKLNAMRGAVIEEQEHNTWSQAQGSQAQGSQAQGSQAQVSRWIKYLDAPEEAEPEEEDEEKFLLDMKQLHANRMTDGYDESTYVVRGHAHLPVSKQCLIKHTCRQTCRDSFTDLKLLTI
uniref:MRN complex-interacting protein N-terminal domain-containing protein n=1 Tax=Labrus bergylta TaxID=56723 RepID=A0A3Q3GQ74_9LABR